MCIRDSHQEIRHRDQQCWFLAWKGEQIKFEPLGKCCMQCDKWQWPQCHITNEWQYKFLSQWPITAECPLTTAWLKQATWPSQVDSVTMTEPSWGECFGELSRIPDSIMWWNLWSDSVPQNSSAWVLSTHVHRQSHTPSYSQWGGRNGKKQQSTKK